MTEDLIAMARKAGAWPELSTTPKKDVEFLRRFAALIEARAVARTREECAKDSVRLDWMEKNAGQHTVAVGGKWYVRSGYGFPHIRTTNLRTAIDNAIRALGERT